jgi:hypothetical protein
MIKTVVTEGVIVPRDPLPEDWHDGTEVAVAKIPGDAATEAHTHHTDVWIDAVEAIARNGNREDDQRLDAALQEARRCEKDLARTKLDWEP